MIELIGIRAAQTYLETNNACFFKFMKVFCVISVEHDGNEVGLPGADVQCRLRSRIG
jgi:hypothetical protein